MRDFDPEKSSMNKVVESCAGSFVIGISIMILFAIIYCVCDPRGVIFLGYWISDDYFYILGTLVVIFHSYLMISIATSLSLTGTLLITYFYYLTVVLTGQLRLGRKRYFTSVILRNPENVRHVFRSFQILNANAMALIGGFILFHHAVFMLQLILILFLLARYWGTLEPLSKAPLLIGMLTLIAFWSFILGFGGFLFIKGKQVIKSWNIRTWHFGKLEDKVMKKFVKSCKPVIVSYGTQFVVKRVTLPLFLKGVARGTLRALLTTKEWSMK